MSMKFLGFCVVGLALLSTNPLEAALVLTPVATRTVNGAFEDVQIDLFARWDGAGSNQVGGYGFQVNLVQPGVGAITNSSATRVTGIANPTSVWPILKSNNPTGGPLSFSFTGGGDPGIPAVVPFGNITVPNAQDATTFVGRINFRANLPGTYTINTLAAALDPLLFSPPGLTGFVQDTTQIGQAASGSPLPGQFVSTSFTINPTAVPEPSTFALCGLAAMAFGVRQYRRAAIKSAIG